MKALKLRLTVTLFVIVFGTAYTQSVEYKLPSHIFDQMATEVYKGRTCTAALLKADSTIKSFKGDLIKANEIILVSEKRADNLESVVSSLGGEALLKESKASKLLKEEKTKSKKRGWIIAGLILINLGKDALIVLVLF